MMTQTTAINTTVPSEGTEDANDQPETLATPVNNSHPRGHGSNKNSSSSNESHLQNSITPIKAAPLRAHVLRSPFQAIRLRKRRRARSAPPVLKTPMIEHHYRVDKDIGVLPGAPKHEEDWHRDTHDFFNLIILIPIVALNVMNWNWEKMVNLKKKETIQDAWTGEWFDLFFACTVLYFLVDFIWIVLYPKCVKSPSTIVQHHVVTMLYIMVPYLRPEYRWAMGACMSVEINTWFLIARRVFNKQGFPPWILIDLSFVSIRIKIISMCFYVTWIGIRCILYPIFLMHLTRIWWRVSMKHHGIPVAFNVEMIPPILLSSFCFLNFKWTYDLIRSKIRYWKRRSNSIIANNTVNKRPVADSSSSTMDQTHTATNHIRKLSKGR